MKKLKDLHPEGENVLGMEKEKLGRSILEIIHSGEKPLKRKEISDHITEGYHPYLRDKVKHAVEVAIGWLEEQLLLGAQPLDEDLIYLTAQGKEEMLKHEHPSELT